MEEIQAKINTNDNDIREGNIQLKEAPQKSGSIVRTMSDFADVSNTPNSGF